MNRDRFYDLTVMLRTYPAVTVLRDLAKKLAEEKGSRSPRITGNYQVGLIAVESLPRA
jgi:hypothetical protein